MSQRTDSNSILKSCDKLTPVELKKSNHKKVYDYIYRSGSTSKQEIASALELSMPTITQHLAEFIECGLIEKRGEYQSTGGRKAQVICCNTTARIAIGVEVLKECVQIVAIDLHGDIIKEDDLQIQFGNCETYYMQLGRWINDFVDQLDYPKETLLGVTIAIQGLVSSDGETITFGEILHCTGVKRTAFQKYIDIPCSLIHDTRASALAEIWSSPDIENAVYLALNRNFGGTVIISSHILRGRELSGGVIEHMCLSPEGPLCYCGKRGCVETFCSADSLRNKAGMELTDFFDLVHTGDPRSLKIWRTYLRCLAATVDNIRMIADFDFILGGYLIQYMDNEDIELLSRYVREQCAFPTPEFSFRVSKIGSKSAKLGAALHLVESFLQNV